MNITCYYSDAGNYLEIRDKDTNLLAAISYGNEESYNNWTFANIDQPTLVEIISIMRIDDDITVVSS